MRVCIHRGAKEIGGTCIEIESQGQRIVLDVGQPLSCPDAESADLPAVPGFRTTDPSLLGVVLSHPHLDHYGLACRLPPNTTFLMGEAAERILRAAAVFMPSAMPFSYVTYIRDLKPLSLGPFTVTPFLMDHSAFDSYAFLIEADGHRLFYTGDLRGHGRKSAVFERLVAHPPPHVDVLLMEGTAIQRQHTEDGFPTESELEEKLTAIFRQTPGMPLVWCSGQNIDRLVTVFRAAKRSGRQFIIDLYAAHILDATGNPNIPQAAWEGVRVYLPRSQKRRVIQQKDFAISDRYRPYRIYPRQLAAEAGRSVMLFRPGMCRELELADGLGGACMVYSMWDGYMAEKGTMKVLAWLEERRMPLHKCHTSGHASLKDLQRLRSAFKDAVVVPVHTKEPSRFDAAFGNARLRADGEWWEVN
jgi:ribonuclease J